MVLTCDICGKKFKRLEDAFTHPNSFMKPRLVHRECINRKLMLFYGGGPFLPVTTSIEMAVPSVVLMILLFLFFISVAPLPLMAIFVCVILFAFALYLRIHFIKYYLEAKELFKN